MSELFNRFGGTKNTLQAKKEKVCQSDVVHKGYLMLLTLGELAATLAASVKLWLLNKVWKR